MSLKRSISENNQKIDAVSHRLSIANKSSKKISSDIKNKYDNVSWNDIQKRKNRLLHRFYYDSVKESFERDLKELNKILDEL